MKYCCFIDNTFYINYAISPKLFQNPCPNIVTKKKKKRGDRISTVTEKCSRSKKTKVNNYKTTKTQKLFDSKFVDVTLHILLIKNSYPNIAGKKIKKQYEHSYTKIA